MKKLEEIKVGIVGYFGHGNAGDEAMRELLLAEFPNSTANHLLEIEKCDAYIIAGGDLVQEFTGLHLPQLWQSLDSEPRYALSLGAKKGWEKHRDLVQNFLSKFSLIYTREQESFEELSKIVAVNGVMPDLVLLTDAPRDDKRYPILFNYTDRPWVDPDGQYNDIISAGEVLPVALSPEEFDLKYSKKVLNFKQFISMAKGSKGVIGTRLHAVVMGVIAGVPLAGVAYENKVKKFCARYEIPCFDYGAKNGKLIFDSLKVAKIDLAQERQKIRTVIEAVKTDLLSRFP